jgi:predicted membrane protein
VVIPAAIVYGFYPEWLLDMSPETRDEHSFAKGVMGLYLAFSLFWSFALFETKLLKTALLSNMLFMLGLGLGRVVGILIDGIPSDTYIIGMFGELILGLYGLWLIRSSLFKKLPQ